MFDYIKKNREKLIYSDRDNLKSIKITTIAVIIMVSLLIYAGDGVIKQKVSHAESIYGSYHIQLKNLTESQQKRINRSSKIDRIGVVQHYSTNKIINRWVDVDIGYYDKESLRLMNLKLISGRYPRDKSEIVFENWIIEYFDFQGGDYSERYVKLLDSVSSTQETDYAEKLPDNYRIVGMLNKREKSNINKNISKTVGLISKKQADTLVGNQRKYYLYIKLKDVDNIKPQLELWKKEFGVDEKNIILNENYINELKEVKKFTFFRNFAVMLIIIITSFILNNVYANFNYEKIRYMGILRAIGTTKKQIYKTMLYEIATTNIKAVILGILIGIMTYLPLTVLLNRYKVNLIVNSVNLKNIVLIALFSCALVITVAFVNIIRINKMNILQLLSVNANIKYSEVKTMSKSMYKIIDHVGTVGKLSFKNIWRNGKRAKKGMLMIIAVCMVFIGINSLKPSHYYYGLLNKNNTDIIISTDFAGYTHEDLAALKEVKGVKTVNTIQNIEVYIDAKSGKWTNKRIEIDTDFTSYIKARVLEFERNIFRNSRLLQGRINLNEMAKQDSIMVNEKFMSIYPNAKIGSIINVIFPYMDSNVLRYDERRVRIVGVVDFINNSFEYDKNKPYIFMNKERVKLATNRMFYSYFQIGLDPTLEGYELEEAKNEIWHLARSRNSQEVGITQKDYEDYNRKTKIIGITILLMLSLLAVLSIISATNDIIMNRARELSMYRILGMTQKQLRNMIVLESVYIGAGSAAIGIGVGTIIMCLSKNIVEKSTDYLVSVSFKWIVLLYFSIVIVSVISGLLSLKNIEKKKLSECIRMVK